jgi:hypothetical protein
VQDTEVDLDYNVLKLRILRLLSEVGPTDSDSLAGTIAASMDFVIRPPLGFPKIFVRNHARVIPLDFGDHALRMALMRYHKQGLLKREKEGGVFRYALTERGNQRLHWLEEQATKKRA